MPEHLRARRWLRRVVLEPVVDGTEPLERRRQAAAQGRGDAPAEEDRAAPHPIEDFGEPSKPSTGKKAASSSSRILWQKRLRCCFFIKFL